MPGGFGVSGETDVQIFSRKHLGTERCAVKGYLNLTRLCCIIVSRCVYVAVLVCEEFVLFPFEILLMAILISEFQAGIPYADALDGISVFREDPSYYLVTCL